MIASDSPTSSVIKDVGEIHPGNIFSYAARSDESSSYVIVLHVGYSELHCRIQKGLSRGQRLCPTIRGLQKENRGAMGPKRPQNTAYG